MVFATYDPFELPLFMLCRVVVHPLGRLADAGMKCGLLCDVVMNVQNVAHNPRGGLPLYRSFVSTYLHIHYCVVLRMEVQSLDCAKSRGGHLVYFGIGT